ncbi:YslB family protein [Bacillus sp. CGMCC 1.16607]|uniref:YslB family protein n=1 Tax=Bacillus sp. CGMCC 1.16607 TaxID=3351842 RepID=UPI00362AEF57
MRKFRSPEPEVEMEDITIPSFGYDLVREELLTNILGKDAPDILYWSGKNLARSYPLQSITEIIAFFEKAGWGQLSIKKETKNDIFFELTSPLIIYRFQSNKETHYKIEAGFLAQQIETQNGMITEAFEQVHKKAGTVEFTVRWDRKDTTEM